MTHEIVITVRDEDGDTVVSRECAGNLPLAMLLRLASTRVLKALGEVGYGPAPDRLAAV
jgi:hypothetical protein